MMKIESPKSIKLFILKKINSFYIIIFLICRILESTLTQTERKTLLLIIFISTIPYGVNRHETKDRNLILIFRYNFIFQIKSIVIFYKIFVKKTIGLNQP